MPHEIINIGSAPGNNGDGDTLRDAFSKTQNNFELLFTHEIVTDTSLDDHADANVPGTIASALARIEANGNGAIVMGSGTFNCSSKLSLRVDIRFIGTNTKGTIIRAQHDDNVIEIGAGIQGFGVRCTLEHFSINMPSTSASSGIRNLSRQLGKGHIEHVEVTGGGAQSWGLTMDSSNEFSISNFKYLGDGNGITWINESGQPFNYGDAQITSTDIRLTSQNTIGIFLQGNSNSVINNILLSRVEVRSDQIEQGTIGIKLERISRITMVNVDIENTDIGLQNGPNSKSCSFISVFALGCNTDYTEIAPVRNTTILGGHGDFLENQKLATRKLELYEASFDDTTLVKTGINDIASITDTSDPVLLTLNDSGSTIFTNRDATGAVSFVLPNASFTKSLDFTFSVLENQELRIFPNNDLDHIRGYDGTLDFTFNGDSYIFSSEVGATATIRNVGNTWWIMDRRLGTWSSSDN